MVKLELCTNEVELLVDEGRRSRPEARKKLKNFIKNAVVKFEILEILKNFTNVLCLKIRENQKFLLWRGVRWGEVGSPRP